MTRVERLPIPERLNHALLALASIVSTAALHGASHAEHPALVVAFAVLFSLSANTLFSLLHEAVHGLYARDRRLNDLAGAYAAAWFPTSLSVQRAFHLTHHKNNRGPHEQFDYLRPGDSVLLKYAQWYAILTGLYWAVTVAGVLVYAVAPWLTRLPVLRDQRSTVATQTSSRPYLEALESIDGRRARLEVLVALGLQAVLVLALDLTLVGWLACYAAFAVQWSGLQYADHAFSPLDPREGAWNLRAPRLLRWAFLNYHDHLAHHREPTASWIHLPALVRADEVRPHYVAMWLTMWRGPRPLPRPGEAAAPVRSLDAWAGVLAVVAVAVAFVALYGGADALSAHVPWRVPLALPGEPFVPFVPVMALVYLSLDVLLLLAPFFLRARDVVVFGLTLITQIALAAIAFVLLPADDVFPPQQVTGWLAPFFHTADALNLDRNFAPSLHVSLSATAAWFYARTVAAPWARAALFAWAAAIAASTLLLHQHYVVDVALGLVLAAATTRLLAPRFARDAVWKGVLVEAALLTNVCRFALRHRRYLVIGLALYAASAFRSGRRVLRTGFVFLQLVDDVLDGDRACAAPPLAYVALLSERLDAPATTPPTSFDLLLADAFREDLSAVRDERDGHDPLAWSRELIAVMARDHERRRDRALLTSEEVTHQLERTFTLSLDLMLVAAGSHVRARDVPALVDALGWCSVVRDLDDDLSKGLINVPEDEWAPIERAPTPAARRAALDAWTLRQAPRARERIAAAEAQVAALTEPLARGVLQRFARSLWRYVPAAAAASTRRPDREARSPG